MVQTIYDNVKAHGGVPMAIGIKVETLSAEAVAQAGKEGEETEFTIQLLLY
ncbi:MAG TPA: hypothetical protein VIJ95_04850 [Hanamia sp.]